MAALHPFATQAQAEPAARILESRPALALVVGHTMAVLRTTTLADRSTDELVSSGVVVRWLVAPLAMAAIRLRTVAVGGARLLADWLTEAKENGSISRAAHLDVVPTHPFLVHHIAVQVDGMAGIWRTCTRHARLGHGHLILDTDVLLAMTVGDGQAADLHQVDRHQDEDQHGIQHLLQH